MVGVSAFDLVLDGRHALESLRVQRVACQDLLVLQRRLKEVPVVKVLSPFSQKGFQLAGGGFGNAHPVFHAA